MWINRVSRRWATDSACGQMGPWRWVRPVTRPREEVSGTFPQIAPQLVGMPRPWRSHTGSRREIGPRRRGAGRPRCQRRHRVHGRVTAVPRPYLAAAACTHRCGQRARVAPKYGAMPSRPTKVLCTRTRRHGVRSMRRGPTKVLSTGASETDGSSRVRNPDSRLAQVTLDRADHAAHGRIAGTQALDLSHGADHR